MISARKADLKNIPPCIKNITFVDFSEGHAKSYNELVVTIRRNILMADWNDPSHVESLLNPKQWKFRTTTIRNVRLSCCVAGHIKVGEAGQDIQETMDELMKLGLDPSSEEYQSIRFALFNGTDCVRYESYKQKLNRIIHQSDKSDLLKHSYCYLQVPRLVPLTCYNTLPASAVP
jgi:hypothetical protein